MTRTTTAAGGTVVIVDLVSGQEICKACVFGGVNSTEDIVGQRLLARGNKTKTIGRKSVIGPILILNLLLFIYMT